MKPSFKKRMKRRIQVICDKWPLVLKSTYKRDMLLAHNSYAEIDDKYWKQAALTVDWERKYNDVLSKEDRESKGPYRKRPRTL